MTFSYFLAIGTVFLMIATLLLVVDWAVFRFAKITTPSLKWVKYNAPKLLFLLTLAATVGSLIYSEVIGYPPCSLCWWQRIFMYSATVVLGLGLAMKDRVYATAYAFVLLLGALLVSAYHSYIQYGGSPLGNCGAGAVSCAERMVWEFGFVTLPLMGMVVSLAGIVLILVSYKK